MMTRYLPMLAKSAAGPFSGDPWLFEIKWDGIRAIAYVDGTVSLQSRNDVEISGQFPELAELIRLAPGTVLDGEIVAMSEGKPDMQALLPRLQAGDGKVPPGHATNPVTYIVFDILEKGGTPLTGLPLAERRKILEQSVREGPHVVLSVPAEGNGEDYYRAAVARGLEGIMAKRKDSPYEPGLRSASWLKIKAKKTCDCVIAGYTLGQGGRGPSFGSLLLGLYENEGGGEPQAKRTSRSLPASSPVSKDTGSSEKRLVYIGKVGSGFTDRDLADLMEVFAKLETAVPQMQGVGQDDRVAWLEPALVCEVAYQEVTRDRKLRIPRFIRLRSGKRPEDCTLDQLAEPEVHPGPAGTGIRDKNQPETGRGGPSVSIPGRGERPRGPGQKGASPEQPMKKYHEKRNFSVTNEPKGTMKMKGEGNYFVVQEHRSHKLHYDLRLEREGVLKSWAVPKGIPESAGEKHLAVAVEDHPLDYGHFEGTIPEGEYGAGTVTIWDNGTYDTRHWDDEKIEVAFHGKRLTGYYVLVRFKRAGKNEWLVFKAVG